MIINFKGKKKETEASANVVDGKLVLSLPDALSPVVWQMDLAQAKASALEVVHNEETGQHTLSLKTPKGEKIEVAVFDQRSHAVEGLMAASGALENAHGHIRAADSGAQTAGKKPHKPAHNAAHHRQKNTRGRLMGTALALVILFILFTIWSSVVPHPVDTGFNTASNETSSSPQNSSGVPVSADAFLRGQ